MTALRRSIVGGRRRFVPGGIGTTDDRGMYRIGRLAPGDYAVAMTTSQVSVPVSVARQYKESMLAGGDLSRNQVFQAMMQIGAMPSMMGSTESRQIGDEVQSMGRGAPTPPPADGPRLFAYPSLFYPAAPSAASAAIVSVASGQERTGIDLQVKPVPMVKVSGTVAGLSGSATSVPVRLIPQGSDDLGRTGDVGGTITNASGAFTFLGVPSGDYVIKIVQIPRPAAPSAPPMAISVGSGMTVSGSFAPNTEVAPVPGEPTMWATVPVAVGDADITGVNIVLRTGLRVSGRVEFEGAADKPTPEQLSRIPVFIEPVDGQMDRGVTPPGRIDAKGQFTVLRTARRPLLRPLRRPTGWTLKGAFLGERDLSDVPLDLDSTDVADVDPHVHRSTGIALGHGPADRTCGARRRRGHRIPRRLEGLDGYRHQSQTDAEGRHNRHRRLQRDGAAGRRVLSSPRFPRRSPATGRIPRFSSSWPRAPRTSR